MNHTYSLDQHSLAKLKEDLRKRGWNVVNQSEITQECQADKYKVNSTGNMNHLHSGLKLS